MGLLNTLFGPKADLSKIKREGAIILDVRTIGEYKNGHGNGSVNIPLDQVKNKIEKLKAYNKPIITCCASGMRSGTAKSILKSNNIEAYNGGSWTKVDQL